MRIYANCHEMYSEVKRDLHEMGTLVHPETMQDRFVKHDPSFKTLELSPSDFQILDGTDRDQWLRDLGRDLDWARLDFAERVGPALRNEPGVNPGTAWKQRESTWSPFIHGGQFAYTYSERFALKHFNQNPEDDRSFLNVVINELRTHPNTRQGVLPVFSGFLDVPNLGGSVRVPCSLHYQFLRRPDGLRAIYVMRSSDFATHFPYDIWLALELQRFIVDVLMIQPAAFTFFTGSLHLYAKDSDAGTF